MATKYETNTWYGWNGGECPVHPKTRIDALEEINVQWTALAEDCDWHSFKGAFRIVTPYVPPLEVWIPVYAGGHLGGNYYSEEQAAQVASGHPGARVALFREVREGDDT